MARKRQQEIPGTERADRIESVEVANEDLRNLMTQRRTLNDKIEIAADRVRSEMRSHNLTDYRYRSDDGVGRKVELIDKVKVKQSKIRVPKDEGDDDGGEPGAEN